MRMLFSTRCSLLNRYSIKYRRTWPRNSDTKLVFTAHLPCSKTPQAHPPNLALHPIPCNLELIDPYLKAKAIFPHGANCAPKTPQRHCPPWARITLVCPTVAVTVPRAATLAV